ncbi:MAG TPA: hypothetical protein VD968_08920 [Pyrinomonadaceae bacterium]|nr:hypothetical protein [Pyrinomonadaceae bacterium]
MKGTTERDEKFTRYLLGDLPEEERVRLEEEYFIDAAAFAGLVAARDELTDLYARGELKDRARERFEQHFLSTEPRRRRAREAKELIEFSTRVAATEATAERARGVRWWPPFLAARSPALRLTFASLLICVAIAGAWLLSRRAGTGPAERAAVAPSPGVEIARRTQPGGEPQTRPGDDGQGSVADAPMPPAATPDPRRAQSAGTASGRASGRPPAQKREAAHVASILLTPVLTRDAGQPSTLHVRPDTAAARLQLSFRGGDYRRYVVVLRTVEGEQVWRGPAAAARASGGGNTAVARVPARVFRRKDHTATLYGVTAQGESHELSEYFFTVSRGVSQ